MANEAVSIYDPRTMGRVVTKMPPVHTFFRNLPSCCPCFCQRREVASEKVLCFTSPCFDFVHFFFPPLLHIRKQAVNRFIERVFRFVSLFACACAYVGNVAVVHVRFPVLKVCAALLLLLHYMPITKDEDGNIVAVTAETAANVVGITAAEAASTSLLPP